MTIAMVLFLDGIQKNKSKVCLWILAFFMIGKSYAQPTLVGMTSQGGTDGLGTIFKYSGDSISSFYSFNTPTPGAGSQYGNLLEASNGKMYGMTTHGGFNDQGVIFEYDAISNNYIKKHDFNGINGAHPYGSLIQTSNGSIYGMTNSGGLNGKGVIFEYDIINNIYTKKYDFNGINGAQPLGSLVQAGNSKLYGMTYSGGLNGRGVIFEYDIINNTYTKKYDFVFETGSNPRGSLIEISNGKVLGMADQGGINDLGVIFEYDLTTNNYTKKRDFENISGGRPNGSLIQTNNGKIYGMTTSGGGANGSGVIFEYNAVMNTYTIKHYFEISNGHQPYGTLYQSNNGKMYGLTFRGGINNFGVIFEYNSITDTYTKIHDFDNTGGQSPQGSLIQANNGKLYGITGAGGANNSGVIFEFNTLTNTFTKKVDFNYSYGDSPYGAVIEASNGKIYGMTNYGGANGSGVIFECDPTTNSYTKKYDLDEENGRNPQGSLIEASNGKMYGLTPYGGMNGNQISPNYGVIFEYDPFTNSYSKLHDFNSTNGRYPTGSLIQANNGKFYGTTGVGGTYGYGVLFEYDVTTNTYVKKHDFEPISGHSPNVSLVQASNGKMYGMTYSGGANYAGVIFEYDESTNSYINKFDFSNTNGARPRGSLILASNEKLYGMTWQGGLNNVGVLFEYDLANNIYLKKYDFDHAHGSGPYGSLIEASNGKLYGMTQYGGEYNKGVIFEYNITTNTYTKLDDFNGTNGANPQYGHLIEINVTPTCPTFTSSPPNVSITNSSCDVSCTPYGGSITAPITPCPTGSSIEYSTDNGANWSTSLPVYAQSGPTQSIITRCVCDIDPLMVSPSSVAETTAPASCTLVTCYADTDGDGHGDAANSQDFCNTCGNSFVSNNTDCDDNDMNVVLCAVACGTVGVNVTLSTQEQVDEFLTIINAGCTEYLGDLTISGSNITDLSPLSGLISIGGFLSISNNSMLVSLNGLSGLTSVGGDLNIENNVSLENFAGLSGLNSIGGNLSIYSNPILADVGGLSNLNSVNGGIYIYINASLNNVDGFSGLSTVGTYLTISSNAVLENLDGFTNLTSVGGNIAISSNGALEQVNGLIGLNSVGGYLFIASNAILGNNGVSDFCGLYPLLNTPNGLTGAYLVYNNFYSPIETEITGACSPKYLVGTETYTSLIDAVNAGGSPIFVIADVLENTNSTIPQGIQLIIQSPYTLTFSGSISLINNGIITNNSNLLFTNSAVFDNNNTGIYTGNGNFSITE